MRSKYNKPGITIHYLGSGGGEYVRKASAYLKGTAYDLYITYDNYALYALAKLEIKARIIFHSLEIVDYKPKSLLKRYKRWFRFGLPKWETLEQRCQERILFSIVQDADREKLLREVYGFVDKVILVPNSNLGIRHEKSDYLRRKYNLNADKKIILYAGALEEWALTDEIIKAAIKWPDEWVFVIHGFNRGDGFNKRIEPLIRKYNQKIWVQFF